MRPGFICEHVLAADPRRLGTQPVLHVEHDAPLSENDTGWSIRCGPSAHADHELRIVDLDRYMDEDPALQELRATLPEGHKATRPAPGQPWIIEPLPPEECAA